MIITFSERKQSSHLKPQTENSGISTELSGSPERPESSVPESLTKTNHKNIKSIQQSSDLQTNSNVYIQEEADLIRQLFYRIESDGSLTPKPVRKFQRQTSAVLCSADSVGDVPNRDDVDGEVFEDYFLPANNALKQRVILFGSTPEDCTCPLLTWRTQQEEGKRSFGKKRKHENIDIKDLLVCSSGPAPETHEPRPECLSVGTCELPRLKK